MHFENVNAIGEPAIRGSFQIFGCGLLHAFERNLVVRGLAVENLVPRELVGFSAEAADALNTADEVGLILRFHASELFSRGPVLEESRQLLFQFFFDLGQITSGLRRRLDAELAGDFS